MQESTRALIGFSAYASFRKAGRQNKESGRERIISSSAKTRTSTLEKEIQSYQESKKASGSAAKAKETLPSEYQNVEQEFKSFFGSGGVRLKLKSEGKGQIVIPFNSVQELNALLDRIDE